MRARGAALVLVLWLVVLLAGLVGAFAFTARVEALQGRTAERGGEAREHARAGVEYAVSRLLAPADAGRWIADGRRYRWRFEGSRVDLRITDERGKVDLNLADRPLIEGLLRVLGVEPARASALAAAVVLRRQSAGAGEHGASAATPYLSPVELRDLPGMDLPLYRSLRPLVTVHGAAGRPLAQAAPDPVLLAMGLDPAEVAALRQSPGPASGQGGGGSYRIESHVVSAQGAHARLDVVVRLQPSAIPGSTYSIAGWEEGTASR